LRKAPGREKTVDANRFKRIVIALKVVLREIDEIRRRNPQAAHLLDNGLPRP